MAYDAVIVGAGHNGLIAGIQLAKAGWSVLVLERGPRAGGAVLSEELTLPGFTHDVFSTNQNLLLGSPFYAEHSSALTRYGLKYAVGRKPYANAFPDGTALGVEQDLGRTLASLGERDGADADGWLRLQALYDRFSPTLFSLYSAPAPSMTMASRMAKAALRLRAGGLTRLGRLLLSSTRELGDDFFATPEAKAMVACWGMHLDLGPDVSGGAMFPFLELFTDQRQGMSIVEGGASRMVEALVGLLNQYGGELRTDAEVRRIITSGDTARQVVLADGQGVTARRAIIASTTPTALFGRLLDRAPARTRQDAAHFGYGPATMMLHLALDGPVPWRAGEAVAGHAYVHIGPYVEDLARTYTASLNGLLPRDPMLVCGQTSVVDPTRAPAGKHVLWVQVRTLPSKIRGDEAAEITATSWEEAAEPYAERVLDRLEGYAPGLRGRVLGRAVLSPLDLERRNPNLVGGDSTAGSMHLRQNFVFRPFPGMSRYATPVKHLYLIGASTWPGTGVNGLSGDHVARRLTRRGYSVRT
ncbi:Phytoene dehydrogenase-related protein [Streptosporangium subroseum]|uniref:Pyridine nucleotide-disulfide oxidoreductase domain-containing protein 2 n=1 Tax=Streptosporangium subroseum TaxID=106412 RepID=A0A239CZV3_9ACTN|nr:NAD(P)/FAD-dependent oxidoreductase [Streptosporangium subroseum]SNS25074.1 Phytoene dehydrogenase-related protein [Streptosporangium subroseum]